MRASRNVAVGLEIRGSRTTVALIDERGKVRMRGEAKTLRGRPAMATLEPCERALEEALTYARSEGWVVQGIGVSLPGTLDCTRHRPLLIPSLPSLNDFPLLELFRQRYDMPVCLFDDMEAALLGEQRFGSGRDAQRLLYLSVNAVVGASLIVDGQITEHGCSQYMGHICHISVSAGGPRCSCGKRGCINTMVSLDAMQKMVQRAIRRGDEGKLITRLLNREAFSPRLLAEEAENGDSVALQIYNEMGRWLSNAVTRYVELFDPHIFILGGDILCTSPALMASVRGAANADMGSGARVQSMVKVVPGLLGRDAALLGSVVPLF
ncbi:ROK family protein [Ktedonospora formicarum]|uniref:Glucokinase n=1 Tax=Ktedonospora formicarum TaxID=2778364 RepID=A0A8J3MXR4_9CHLR|nr:ROK family protein [Ktedonospora formicarum]GHO49993.1 glucokinase [Ktedonospora formicarum]